MKIVDHEERKNAILSKALSLFARMGYEQVTYQQLADNCGLSRTALYKYFPNKKDVFDNALFHLVKYIGKELKETLKQNPQMKAAERLELVAKKSIDMCVDNPALLQTIFEYLLAQKRQGESVERKIRRHTVTFRCEIKNIVQDGIASGEFRQVSPINFSDMFFSLLQAAVIRIIFYDDADKEHLIVQCKVLIDAIKM